MSTEIALAFLAGFLLGAATFTLAFLWPERRPRATMCCGTAGAPCDDFHGTSASDRTYCERCHHHWTCHDTEYDTL